MEEALHIVQKTLHAAALRVLIVGEDEMIAQVLKVRIDTHFSTGSKAEITQFSGVADAAREAFRKEYQAIVLAPTLEAADFDSQNTKGENLLRQIRSGKFGEPTTSTPVVLICGVSGITHEDFRSDPLTYIVDTVRPHASHEHTAGGARLRTPRAYHHFS